MTRRAHGFTLFEFAVSASLCALLAVALLSRVAHYQAESERVVVQQLVASVRTALSVRAAQVLAARGEPGLRALALENPLTWLARVPQNYQGEYYRPPADLLKPGFWYYDQSDKTINFLLRNDTFSSGTSKLLKFKVELLREPVPTRSGGRKEATLGLVFDRVKRTASDNTN
ncbi:hypothetical protein [Massilia sp. 9I]|uniref:hypothetical protein n=1 Tax=Massilia sp. 9I TaxID=2653152 RepID=UPI0012F2CF8C|nr:hypothetical protein [Massilia sp. 9I]VXB07082.1 MSHA pilin protein MshA [Massilia sp. 9I]